MDCFVTYGARRWTYPSPQTADARPSDATTATDTFIHGAKDRRPV